MSELPRVKVVNPGVSWRGTEYYINDQKIGRVRAVDFRVAVDEVPTFVFETLGAPDIDISGGIRFSFTPQTVTEAVKVLRNELLQQGDLYDGFLASMRSTIHEAEKWHNHGWLENSYDEKREDLERLAECMLKRLAGEE